MPSFQNLGEDGVRASLERDEAQLLRGLLDEMGTLLEADVPPSDPVMKRLFPDAYEDPKQASEYRELVGAELLEDKRQKLRVIRERLGRRGPLETWIPPEEIGSWLTLLTDLRLAIGTRLEVTEEMMEKELEPEHPDAPALSVLHWLGWVQGSLLEALTDRGEGT